METSSCSETTQQKKNDKFHRSIVDPMTLVHAQLRSRVLKAATTTKTDCVFEGSWGIVSMLKSLQKQLQRRHRQRCLEIDTLIRLLMFFWTVVLSLLASRGNSVRAPFLVHQVPRTSAPVWRYRRMFTQFSLRVRVSDYTWRPMIAGLLYHWNVQVLTNVTVQVPFVYVAWFSRYSCS